MNGRKYNKGLDLTVLSVDPAVQRGLSVSRISEMASKFNPDFLGTVTVSRRASGRHVLLDGMHRVEAARSIGWTGEVNALVYTGLSRAEEAALFLHLNDTRQVSALDRFRVRLVEGDKAVTDMNAILDAHGWTVSGGVADPYRFAAVAALEKIYQNFTRDPEVQRSDLVHNTIHAITEAWQGEPGSAHQTIVAGVGLVFSRYGDKVDGSRLASRLALQRPATLIGKAKAVAELRSRQHSAGMAEVLVSLYNNGLRASKLKDWS